LLTPAPTCCRGRLSTYFLKLSSDGEFVWAEQFYSPNASTNAVATDRLGNVYLTGAFGGDIDFDPGPGTHLVSSVPNSGDIFVLKLDGDGKFVWVDAMGGTSNEHGQAIAIDGNGNVYVTGTFFGKPDFDPGPGVFTIGTGSAAVFIEKLNGDGNFLWMRKINGTGWDQSTGIAVDAVGSVYTTGTFEGTVDFDPGQATTFSLTSLV
jgi:hypothetical protein